MTILGVSAFAACASAAAEAKRTGIATPAGLAACDRATAALPPVLFDLAGAYVNRSVIRIAQADNPAAIADASTAIRLNPMLAVAYLDRGIAESAEQYGAQAERDFTQALRLNLVHPELAYFDRALAREDAGDVKGAYFDYRKAAELNPKWAQPQHELARFSVVGGAKS